YESDLLAGVDDNYYEAGKEMLQTVVKEDLEPIERRLYSASRFVTFLAWMVQKFTSSDAGLVHTGLIAKPLDGGSMTEYDLHKVLPHAINAVQIELTGRELKEVINQASKHEHKN